MGLADRDYMREPRGRRRPGAVLSGTARPLRSGASSGLAGVLLFFVFATFVLWFLARRDYYLNPAFLESMQAHTALSWANLKAFRIYVVATHVVSAPYLGAVVLTFVAALMLGPAIEKRLTRDSALRIIFGVGMVAGVVQLVVGAQIGGPVMPPDGGLLLVASGKGLWSGAPGAAWALVILALFVAPGEKVSFLKLPVWIVAGLGLAARVGNLVMKGDPASLNAVLGLAAAVFGTGVVWVALRIRRRRARRKSAEVLLRGIDEIR